MQNRRGSRIEFEDFPITQEQQQITPLEDEMEDALEIERNINSTLVHLKSLALKHGDKEMVDFLGEEFTRQEAKSVTVLYDYVMTMRQMEEKQKYLQMSSSECLF